MHIATCSKCGSSELQGRQTVCRACRAAQRKAYFSAYKKANREKVNAQNRAYRQANPEQRKREHEAWSAARRQLKMAQAEAEGRPFYLRVKTMTPEQLAQRAERMRTKAREDARREYATPDGRERIKAAMSRYYRTPKGRAFTSKKNAQRRARMGIDTSLTGDEWIQILADHGNACRYCRVPFSESVKATMDHVHPIALGGQHVASNIVPACQPCNSSKGTRTWPLRVGNGTDIRRAG